MSTAHTIIEQTSPRVAEVAAGAELAPVGLQWGTSAANGNALDLQVCRLRSFVALNPGHAQVEIGFSLVGNGSRLSRRAVFVANQERVLVIRDVAVEPSLTVSFSGHGSQRLGSARGLYERFPVFARTFEEVLGQLDEQLAGSMRDALSGDDFELFWSFAAGLPSRSRRPACQRP
ncbi:MAG: hypothetical protein QOE58_2283 [Actinomycetota bacterium]|jgi:acyl transferase domain-containing protein|nr:hypothetical protein [Actinomycetota bacterium]